MDKQYEVFDIGDKVVVVKAPRYVGAKGSDWMTPIGEDDPNNLFCIYDLSHCEGKTGVIRGFLSSWPPRKGETYEESVERNKKDGMGWYHIDFDEEVLLPAGLHGFEPEQIEKL